MALKRTCESPLGHEKTDVVIKGLEFMLQARSVKLPLQEGGKDPRPYPCPGLEKQGSAVRRHQRVISRHSI